ncbi:MAG: ABC transporter permease [Actinomycetota bacterium]|jgi:branched-subunit amino acid ABC-type transport system permease component
MPFIVAGVTNGSIYGLAAVGLVLTYKTSGIFNFAHGSQAALGAYLMFEFRDRMGMPWPVAGLLALLLAGVVAGLLLERGANVLASCSVAARVTATVGLLVFIQGVLIAIFGSASIPVPPFLSQKTFDLGGTNVRVEQLIIVAFVFVAVVGLYLFFTRAKLGLAVQAVVDDPALLGLAGTSPSAVRRFSWVVGSCFAALSGILLAPSLALDARLLTLLVFFAFGAAAVGAFSSLPLTYVGGIGLGLAAAITTKILGETNITGPIGSLPANLPFLVLFVALLVTPTRKLVERGTQVVRRPLPPVTFSRPVKLTAGVVGLGVALVIPHVVGAKLPIYMTGVAYVILFASLGLLVRTSGQVSLCHIAFAAVGCSTAARVVVEGVPWPLAVLAGGLVAVPIGALLAIPAIRLSGVYLAIATFGFGLVIQRLFYASMLMFGGRYAIPSPRPKLGGLNTHTDVGYYHVVLGVAVACLAVMMLIRRSRMGRLLRAFADSSTGVDAHGTNTNELKVLVFSISAFFSGIAGGLLGPITGTASAASGIDVGGFDFSVSLLLITVLFVAGRQPIVSAVLGSVLLVIIPSYATGETAVKWNPIVFGSLAIVAALFGGRSLRDWLASSRRLQERAASPSPQAERARVPELVLETAR